MTTPIRPSPLPLTPSRPQAAPGEAARAAQRAFFSQALNGVQSQAPAAESTPAPPVQRQAVPERIELPAEPPTRAMRPGSYLDIKV